MSYQPQQPLSDIQAVQLSDQIIAACKRRTYPIYAHLLNQASWRMTEQQWNALDEELKKIGWGEVDAQK